MNKLEEDEEHNGKGWHVDLQDQKEAYTEWQANQYRLMVAKKRKGWKTLSKTQVIVLKEILRRQRNAREELDDMLAWVKCGPTNRVDSEDIEEVMDEVEAAISCLKALIEEEGND